MPQRVVTILTDLGKILDELDELEMHLPAIHVVRAIETLILNVDETGVVTPLFAMQNDSVTGLRHN